MRKSIIQTLFPNIGFQAFLGGLCLFLLIPPNAVGIPPHFLVAEYGFLILMILGFDRKIILKKADVLFAIALVLLYLYLSLHSRELSFKGFAFTLLLPTMMWAKKNYIKTVFDAFSNIYVYLMSLSCLVYILVLLGVPLPHENWSLDDATSYTIVDVYAKICGVSMMRFCAFFQEPGVVGTISAIILVAYRFRLPHFFLIVLVFSGIASFSFTFFVILGLYAIICSRSWKVIIGALLVSGILYFFFYDLVNELVLYKLSYGENVLDFNRTHGDFSSWYDSFKKTSAYYWGLGGGTAFIYDPGGASYKDLIVDYGVVFFAIYSITYALYAKLIIRPFVSWVSYLLIMLVILYQRPFIVLPTYLFLLYAPMIVLKDNASQLRSIDKTNSIKSEQLTCTKTELI